MSNCYKNMTEHKQNTHENQKEEAVEDEIEEITLSPIFPQDCNICGEYLRTNSESEEHMRIHFKKEDIKEETVFKCLKTRLTSCL